MAVPRATVFLAGLFIAVAGLAGAAQPDGGYITDWLVAGPLNTEAPLDAVLGLPDGAGVKYCEGDPAPGCKVRWTRYRGDGNVINLRMVTGYDPEGMTALAFCEFKSDSEQLGRIHCVSPNTFKLWLNGSLVFEKPEGEYEPLRWTDHGVKLRQGANFCLAVCSTLAGPFGTYAAPLLGFALRVDGPRETPAQPLVWDPIVPSVPFVDDGRYVLLSPEWRYMEGDDPEWAKPGFDDSNWKTPTWPPVEPTPEAGSTYWMRVRAHFAPGSTLVPYALVSLDAFDMEVYLDGVRVHGADRFDVLLDPFHYRDTTLCLPSECTLAVRVVSAGPLHPIARLALRRADKAASEELSVRQPRKHHRVFLVFCLLFSLLYYLLVYRSHPRQIEGTVCFIAVTLSIVSMLLSTTDSWTFHHMLPTYAWWSSVVAAIAYMAGIAMVHVMASGTVSWRAVLGYAAVSVMLFAAGWKLDSRWVAFSVFPLMTLEYVRVWTMYDLIPGRANRGYVGIGLLFLVAGEIASALYGTSNGHYFSAVGPYAHLYGLVGLAACLVMYTSRESALGMHELQGLTATLEDKIKERTQQVQELTRALITAEEAERERLARDLHDSVAQTLWFAKMAAEDQLPAESDNTRTREIIGLLDKAIDEVRVIAYGLRPPELDKLGFVHAISQSCRDFSHNTGIPLDYKSHGVDNIFLSPVAEVNLYRVLQEALNNVQQHAGASSVRVRLLGAFPSVILRVEDDGRGFDMALQRAEEGGHMGLRSMEERIRLIGGRMSIRSAPGGGVRVVFEIPQQTEQA